MDSALPCVPITSLTSGKINQKTSTKGLGQNLEPRGEDKV